MIRKNLEFESSLILLERQSIIKVVQKRKKAYKDLKRVNYNEYDTNPSLEVKKGQTR